MVRLSSLSRNWLTLASDVDSCGFGKGQCLDEPLLKLRIGRQLVARQSTRDLHRLPALVPVQQCNAGAVAGGIADNIDLLQIHLREHTNGHGVLLVDVGAKGAGQQELVRGIQAHAVQQGTGGNEEGALGQLHLTDVLLREADVVA